MQDINFVNRRPDIITSILCKLLTEKLRVEVFKTPFVNFSVTKILNIAQVSVEFIESQLWQWRNGRNWICNPRPSYCSSCDNSSTFLVPTLNITPRFLDSTTTGPECIMVTKYQKYTKSIIYHRVASPTHHPPSTDPTPSRLDYILCVFTRKKFRL